MVDTTIRHYTLHSEHECDRLELQARIAGIEDHMQYLRIPGRESADTAYGLRFPRYGPAVQDDRIRARCAVCSA